MNNINYSTIQYALKHRHYPLKQIEFINEVAFRLMDNVPETEILNYPITTARQDYYQAALKICDIFNSNNIKKVFGISTFKGLNTLHKKCVLQQIQEN